MRNQLQRFGANVFQAYTKEHMLRAPNQHGITDMASYKNMGCVSTECSCYDNSERKKNGRCRKLGA